MKKITLFALKMENAQFSINLHNAFGFRLPLHQTSKPKNNGNDANGIKQTLASIGEYHLDECEESAIFLQFLCSLLFFFKSFSYFNMHTSGKFAENDILMENITRFKFACDTPIHTFWVVFFMLIFTSEPKEGVLGMKSILINAHQTLEFGCRSKCIASSSTDQRKCVATMSFRTLRV